MAFELMDMLKEEADRQTTMGAKAIYDFNVLRVISELAITAIVYIWTRRHKGKVSRMKRQYFPVSSKSSKCSFQGARSASNEVLLKLKPLEIKIDQVSEDGRGRVQLKQIENKISRQVTFSKRRMGLRKKAHEISVLCDAQVALIVFNAKGKLFEFSSESSMENVLERYERHATVQLDGADKESQRNWSLECFKLTGKVEVLERNLRNFVGDDLDPLSLRELQSLEHQLDTALKRIRTRKNLVMNDSISELQKKAKALQEQNNMLSKKIKEKEKTVAERPPCWSETALGQNSSAFNLCPPELQSPQRLVPSLTLGFRKECSILLPLPLFKSWVNLAFPSEDWDLGGESSIKKHNLNKMGKYLN
ncbi:hypothetical protein SESBI_19179 [Sesbania bispinosa]|nr:hypothetical protein SESBI_19179 [Sesbania bispinosa]